MFSNKPNGVESLSYTDYDTMNKDILSACQPLFDLSITFFNYVRVFYDGHRVALCTTPKWIDNFIKKQLYLHPYLGKLEYPDQIDSARKIVLSIGLDCVPAYDQAFTQFDVGDWLAIIERNDLCVDYIFFAPSRSERDSSINNFYINNIPLFLSFKEYFSNELRDYLTRTHSFYLPYPELDNNLDIITEDDVNSHSVELFYHSIVSSTLPQYANIKLSKRERECAELILDGKTAKEIGLRLGLSNRTVELYIMNMKKKLHCNSRSELVSVLVKLRPFIKLLNRS